MKPSQILLEYAGLPLDALPDSVQERLEKQPVLKAEFQQQAEVADLLQLKNYECPDEAMFGRVHHRVQIRLKHQAEARPVPVMDRLPTWVRMAAVVVVMLGLSVITHREMLRAPEEMQTGMAASLDTPASMIPEPAFDSGFDPFTTYVFAPSFGSEDPPMGLTRELEADFEFLGLQETNRLETTSLLPVLLPASP